MSTNRRAYRQGGYALLIMLVLVAMGVLYLVVNGADVIGMKHERSDATQIALQRAKEALIGYAATYRDSHSGQVFGYLPCPDMTDAPILPPLVPRGNGIAENNCGILDATVAGLLPYQTLGLEALRDEEGICLWYIVSGNFKNSPESSPMNWDTQGEIRIDDASGNQMLAPDDPNGGAAALVIAARAPLGGQARTSNPNNVCGAMPSEIAAYVDSAVNGTGISTMIQGDKFVAGNLVNNDRVLAVTPKEIFDRVASRNDFKNSLTASTKGDINVLTDRIRALLEFQMWPSIVMHTSHAPGLQPSNQAGYTQAAGRYIGDLPAGATLNGTNYESYMDNWRDQYRYSLCSSTTAPCLTVNGDNCYGALLFSGRGSSGSPRSSSQKPPPAAPETYTDLLGNYFESGLAMLDGSAATFTGNVSYDAGIPAADVAACLINKSNILSFGTDIGTLNAVAANAAYPLVAVNTATQTVTLGNVSGSGPAALAGCVWFQDALRFSTSLRVYFEFVIQDAGQGFTFAVADAAQNGNSVPACGAAGHALGYAGTSVGSGIQFPKIGLEIDTASQSARRDPGQNHAAFVFWGSAATDADDNTHNAGAGTAAEPLNPRSLTSPQARAVLDAQWSSGIVTVTLPPPPLATSFRFESNQAVTISGTSPSGYNGTFPITVIDDTHFTYPLATDPGAASSVGTARARFTPGIATVSSTSHFNTSTAFPLTTTILVRLDISKRYTAPLGLYTMKAYIADANRLGANAATGSYSPTCTADDLKNVFLDLEDLCEQNPMIARDDLPIADISGEALEHVYLGFTNGQSSNSGAGNQSIVISNFIGRTQ